MLDNIGRAAAVTATSPSALRRLMMTCSLIAISGPRLQSATSRRRSITPTLGRLRFEVTLSYRQKVIDGVDVSLATSPLGEAAAAGDGFLSAVVAATLPQALFIFMPE